MSNSEKEFSEDMEIVVLKLMELSNTEDIQGTIIPFVFTTFAGMLVSVSSESVDDDDIKRSAKELLETIYHVMASSRFAREIEIASDIQNLLDGSGQ